MSIPPKVGALLGFARKAGFLQSGESAVISALKKKRVELLIIAADVPEKKKSFWLKWSENDKLKAVILGLKHEYGDILGMSERGILALTDKKMAEAIFEAIQRALKIDTEI